MVIKKLIQKILTGKASKKKSTTEKRCEMARQEHGICQADLDPNAVSVVEGLQRAGYEAYVVGGAVRDLLLGLKPKDFDVATNATPEEVKSLFRRAFIIGRRFRIVHVVFGRGRQDRGLSQVIEVSTFRAQVAPNKSVSVKGNERSQKHLQADHATDASGRVLRDNVWGNQSDDAARRDFSINALYYDPIRDVVIDYHQGVSDLKHKKIRLIGDPVKRYQEDPVRLVRAIRFLAKLGKLGFVLDDATAQPILSSWSLLEDIPPSRLFDESLKLLQTGHGQASLEALHALGLTQYLHQYFPLLAHIAKVAKTDALLTHALQDTDRRVAEGKSVSPSFLLACAFWAPVQRAWIQLIAGGMKSQEALFQAVTEFFENSHTHELASRGRLSVDMREVWLMQPRFERFHLGAATALVAQPRFRAALDFLRLRSLKGELSETVWAWWEAFYHLNSEERESFVKNTPEPVLSETAPAPAKRRRRRRKPKEAE